MQNLVYEPTPYDEAPKEHNEDKDGNNCLRCMWWGGYWAGKESENLTKRNIVKLNTMQLQILYYLAEGYTIVEIAKELKYSVSGLKHHVKKLYKDLGVFKQSQAIYKAAKLNLI